MFFLTFLHAQNWCYLVFLLATTERHQRQGGNDHDCKGGFSCLRFCGGSYLLKYDKLFR